MGSQQERRYRDGDRRKGSRRRYNLRRHTGIAGRCLPRLKGLTAAQRAARPTHDPSPEDRVTASSLAKIGL